MQDQNTITEVSTAEFIELLDAVDQYLKLSYSYRKNPNALEYALKITKEMRFVAHYNHKFRNENYQQLDVFFKDLYSEVQLKEEIA